MNHFINRETSVCGGGVWHSYYFISIPSQPIESSFTLNAILVPGFVLNCVLPNANMGHIVSVENQGYPSTAGWIKALWNDLEGNEDLLANPRSIISMCRIMRGYMLRHCCLMMLRVSGCSRLLIHILGIRSWRQSGSCIRTESS